MRESYKKLRRMILIRGRKQIGRQGKNGMCCRYFMDDAAAYDVREMTEGRVRGGAGRRRGDIYPSQAADVITGTSGELYAQEMRWGFPSVKNAGQLMINARAESALEKRSFSDSVRRRRCVIPAAGFYEWDRDKNKVTFTLPDRHTLYLAGCYDLFGEEDRFVILTTAANESMRPVHDRMPLLLPKDAVRDWICRDEMIAEYLKTAPEALSAAREYEQIELSF